MKYRAKQLLNIRAGVICRAGEIVPKEYGRLDEAINRGWVEPISDEDYLSIVEEKKGRPTPPMPVIPKRGERVEPDESTTFYKREERFKASGDDLPRRVDPDAIVDDGDYKKASKVDTTFEKESPLETGEADLAEETAKDAIKEGHIKTLDGIGLDTLIANLPYIQGRAIKGLPDAGITIIGDLVGKTLDELTKIKGIGEHTANELLKTFIEVSKVNSE